MCNFPLLTLAETCFLAALSCSPAGLLVESESQALCWFLWATYASTLSSHSVCDSGWPQLSWLLEILASQPSKALPLWLVFPPGTVSASIPTLAPSPAPCCGCSMLVPCKAWEEDSWFTLSSYGPSLLVISLQTKSKKGRSASISYLLTFLSKSESSIYSFMHSFNKNLRVKDVPGTVLGTGCTAIKQTDKKSCPRGAYILVREITIKMINK